VECHLIEDLNQASIQVVHLQDIQQTEVHHPAIPQTEDHQAKAHLQVSNKEAL
jgi:hypothetical protein